MADSYYVPQIDYQSRDFTSIRDDLINLIPNFAPQWTSRDSTDFGIVLIELFSYMGDILNYYIDRAANESFLATATQRDTVLNLARLLNYSPGEPVPSQITVQFSNYSTTSTVPVKYLSQYQTSTPDTNGNYVYFESITTTSDTVLGTASSATSPATATLTVTEGQTVATTQIGVSDGTPDQVFPIYDDALIYASSNLQITVGGTISGGVVSGGTTYDKVNYLIDYGQSDTKYNAFYDGNNILNIRFGDGVSGKIPPANAVIWASYRKGLGSSGNVGATTVTVVVSNSGGSTNYSVTNTSSTPVVTGTDPESMDSIRINAPLSLRSLNRAVSLSDYSSLALNGSNLVLKASAVADNYSSIIIFVMGAAWNNNLSSTVRNNVQTYFVGKTPPGTAVTVLNGSIAYTALTVAITAEPTASNDTVKYAAYSAIKDLLSFDNVTFNDSITQSDIQKTLRAVPGVADLSITGLERRVTSTSAASTTVNSSAYFYINEVPKYDEQNITITVSGGV